MTTVIVAAVTLVLSAILTWIVSSAYQKKVTEGKIGSAEERARGLDHGLLKVPSRMGVPSIESERTASRSVL